MKKTLFVFFIIIILSFSKESASHTLPPDGILPDSSTAILVARPILQKYYGKSVIDGEEPLKAEKINGFWLVRGTFNHPGSDGGVAEILINSKNCEVVNIIHER